MSRYANGTIIVVGRCKPRSQCVDYHVCTSTWIPHARTHTYSNFGCSVSTTYCCSLCTHVTRARHLVFSKQLPNHRAARTPKGLYHDAHRQRRALCIWWRRRSAWGRHSRSAAILDCCCQGQSSKEQRQQSDPSGFHLSLQQTAEATRLLLLSEPRSSRSRIVSRYVYALVFPRALLCLSGVLATHPTSC